MLYALGFKHKKGRWALLKTRFRGSLSSLNENRDRNMMDFQQTANSRYEFSLIMI
jgi:hypothetical protein